MPSPTVNLTAGQIDYYQRNIAKAQNDLDADVLAQLGIPPRKANTKAKTGTEKDQPEWQLVRFSTKTAQPIRWLWPGFLAEGKLTMLNGEPGHGKSLVTLDIAARLTTASAWPDGTPNTLPPSDVLLLTQEEDAEDTILPRFQIAGGNPTHLVTLSVNNGDGSFQIERDGDRLQELLKTGSFKLIILDPVIDFTRAKQNMEEEVRPMLNKLVKLARESNVAILGVNHLNKKTDLSAAHRVAGARAWTGVARLNFLLGKGDDPSLRHICPLKMNVAADDGASLDYTISSTNLDIPDDRGGIRVSVPTSQPKVIWQGKGSATVDTITKAQTVGKEEAPASEWLRDYLHDGTWHPVKRLYTDGIKDGFSQSTLLRSLRKIGAESRMVGMPAKGEWCLPATSPATSISSERVEVT